MNPANQQPSSPRRLSREMASTHRHNRLNLDLSGANQIDRTALAFRHSLVFGSLSPEGPQEPSQRLATITSGDSRKRSIDLKELESKIPLSRGAFMVKQSLVESGSAVVLPEKYFKS